MSNPKPVDARQLAFDAGRCSSPAEAAHVLYTHAKAFHIAEMLDRILLVCPDCGEHLSDEGEWLTSWDACPCDDGEEAGGAGA